MGACGDSNSRTTHTLHILLLTFPLVSSIHLSSSSSIELGEQLLDDCFLLQPHPVIHPTPHDTRPHRRSHDSPTGTQHNTVPKQGAHLLQHSTRSRRLALQKSSLLKS